MAEYKPQLESRTTEIHLNRARDTYLAAHKRNDKGLGYFSERFIKDEGYKSARERYEEAKRAHLTALANAYGPDRAIDFAKAEKKKLGWLKLKSWEKGVFYAGGATAVVGATVGLGPLTLLSSIGISLGVNEIFKRTNFMGWRDDSPEVEDARTVLTEKWRKAQTEGLTYEEFLKRERKAVKEYSRQMGKDRRTRLYVRATVSGAALGVTGIRPGLLGAAADGLDTMFGKGVGDAIVYGDHWVQKFVRSVAVPLIDGILHPISPAAAADYNPKLIDAEGKVLGEFHWPTESFTPADLAHMEQVLTRSIAWAEKAADEYARTMDMHDEGCVRKLTAIRESIHQMKLVQEDLARGRGSFLRKMAELNVKVPGQMTANNVKILLQEKAIGRAFLNLDRNIDVVQGGADQVAQLGGGKVFVTGTPQEIKNFFKAIGIEFNHPDQWKMTPRTARMLMELYRDIKDNPQLRRGLIITVGDDGDGINTGHSPNGGHPTGDAFDMLPTGPITRDYIQAMYAMMYENMLIAHHDPRIIEYFHMKIAEFDAMGEKGLEMKHYYQCRLRWAQNPFARQYYEFIYEPGDSGPPGIKEEVIARLMKEYGIDRYEAERFMQLKYGNSSRTTGEHFHIWPPAEDRDWRSDPTSYAGPEKRSPQPQYARSTVAG